jgi:hypothetical protein
MNVMTRRLPPKETAKMTTSIPQPQKENTPATATKARVAKRRAHVAPSKGKPARNAPRAKKAAPARRGSKTAKILDLLKRPGGVTLKELTKATGWRPHSVRGFLSGTVGKKMGTPVESSKRGDGERAYRISSK